MKKVLMLLPWQDSGRYMEWGGSLKVRPVRGRKSLCTSPSSLPQSSCGGCASRGLKLVRELRSVLWMYVVVSLLSWQRVVEVRRSNIACLIFVFVGAVSPRMLSMVPKCLL